MMIKNVPFEKRTTLNTFMVRRKEKLKQKLNKKLF